jgi:solute carrier family 25 folate transporter 32
MNNLQQPKVESKKQWTSSFADSTAPLIAGLAGGSVSTALLHPLDLIKVRLQANEDVPTSTWFGRQTRRRGLMSMLSSIVRHEGPLSLYNGLSPGLVASAVSWGGYFFFYEKFKSQLSKRRQERVGPIQQFFASCAASTVMIAVTNPLWLIKTRMQLQIRLHGDRCPTNQAYYTGIVNAFQTIIKEEGPAALYKVRKKIWKFSYYNSLNTVSHKYSGLLHVLLSLWLI